MRTQAAKDGRLEVALTLYRSACTCIRARSKLTSAPPVCWSTCGRIDEAVAAYENAREIAPASSPIFSALLFHRHYLSPLDPARIFGLHRAYGAMMQEVWPRPPAIIRSKPDPERRLRIGYVSPNLSRHSVGYFIEPVIRSHDRQLVRSVLLLQPCVVRRCDSPHARVGG